MNSSADGLHPAQQSITKTLYALKKIAPQRYAGAQSLAKDLGIFAARTLWRLYAEAQRDGLTGKT